MTHTHTHTHTHTLIHVQKHRYIFSRHFLDTRRADMARHLTQKPLMIQDENLNIPPKKKALADGNKLKTFGGPTKKGGAGTKDRKALNDITNKSSLQTEVPSRKKDLPPKEFNYAEEGFLHDHRKCIAAQQATRRPDFLDTVLPGHDELWNTRQPAESDVDTESRCDYPEPAEMPMFELCEWAKVSSIWKSPPPSPRNEDIPFSSHFAWQDELVEFVPKEDNCF